MQIKNSSTHFGAMAILLHWVMAFIIIGLLCLGLYMTGLPIGSQKLKLYGWHKEFGILILMLAMIRIFWRLTNLVPTLVNLSVFERLAARTVHWLFYGLMLAMPLTGWLMSSSAGVSVSFFGLFIMPDLISPDQNTRHLLGTIHEFLAYGLIATILLHTLAAFKHYFIDKDDILQRMLS